jgi:transposase
MPGSSLGRRHQIWNKTKTLANVLVWFLRFVKPFLIVCGQLVMCPDFVAHDLSGFWNRWKEGFRRLGIGMQPEVRVARLLDAVAYRAGRLSCVQAAELLGMSERHFRRLRDRYEADGADGLIDRRRGRASGRRAPVDQLEWVIEHYRTRYWDFTVKHFHERLREEHGFPLGHT